LASGVAGPELQELQELQEFGLIGNTRSARLHVGIHASMPLDLHARTSTRLHTRLRASRPLDLHARTSTRGPTHLCASNLQTSIPACLHIDIHPSMPPELQTSILTRLHIGIHGSVPPDPWVYASAYTRAYCAQGALLGAKKKTSPTLELNPMHGQKLKQFSPQPEVGNSPWITHL
jgi:hypothetical protein